MIARARMAAGLAGLAALAACAFATSAEAHFVLKAPAASQSQTSNGDPQKLGPCGDEGGATPSNIVTPFRPGQAVDITIREAIYHPGHYRVALAVNDRSELPPEPKVYAGDSPCGRADFQTTPAFPVLGDHLLAHDVPFRGDQTMRVVLPSNVTCTKCTLQIIEFMSDHGLNDPGGCFYHHCANIAIQGDAVDGGVPDVTDGGVEAGSGNGDSGSSSSGGCSMPPGEAPAASGLAGLFALTFLIRRAGARRRP